MELFKGKILTAFSLFAQFPELIKSGKLGEYLKESHSRLATTFKSDVPKMFKLEDIVEALAYYEKNTSKGKILLQLN